MKYLVRFYNSVSKTPDIDGNPCFWDHGFMSNYLNEPSWDHGCMSNYLNEPGLKRFLDMYYLQAWEDWAPDGSYDYLCMLTTTRHAETWEKTIILLLGTEILLLSRTELLTIMPKVDRHGFLSCPSHGLSNPPNASTTKFPTEAMISRAALESRSCP
jgi:hypothetical protein